MTEQPAPPGPVAPGILSAGAADRRASLAGAQRAIYRAVLRSFASTGGPPAPAALNAVAQPFGSSAAWILAELSVADCLGLDKSGRIRMAYPFSAEATPHIVAVAGGPQVYAMCAVDALGIAPMLGTDVSILSVDPLTGVPINVAFSGGRARWDPASAVVFVGHTECAGRAEQTRCGYMNFFTGPSTAATWAAGHPDVVGAVLDQSQAEELGATIFGSLLADDG